MEPDEDASPEASPEALETAILGEQPTLTAAEAAREGGASLEQARRLWRALGFPEYDDESAFTSADVDALTQLRGLVDAGLVDFDTAVTMTRGLGQTMARLADWQVSALLPLLSPDDSSGRIAAALDRIDLERQFEAMLVYAWRRHLAAAVARAEPMTADGEEHLTTEVTVGFADLVSFTALSNQIDEDRLGDLVELFESRCHDVVSTHRGRVVKSLGDSVLFTVDDPVRALDIADGIIAVIGRDARMPDVRLGLASGAVVMRMGDVFGPPVNLASRLTSVARRNRVIIDDATAAMLPASRFETRKLPARPIRGFGLVEPIAVRRH